MTGYSTPHASAVLHPDDCTCPACVDAAIISEDSAAIGRADWIDMRRETIMQDAERAADERVSAHDEWLMHIADQYDDWCDWRWSIGHID